MEIGIGTYSFGGAASFLGLGPTLEEKLRTISAMGFNTVELLAVDLEHEASDIKRWLNETGLRAVSVHAQPTQEVVRKMAALGGEAVIWPGTPFCDKAEAIEVAHELDAMAAMAAPFGIKIGYHNHSQEFFFDEGKTLLEHLLDNSEKCYSQLDCGWAMNGGAYPPSFIRKYCGRILSIHVKENCRVAGPGEKPASRHAQSRHRGFGDVKSMSQAERQKILDTILAHEKAAAGRFNTQCPMGAEQSNLNWAEIKKALDEQPFPAFWIVEREGFYAGHDQCIQEDLQWLKAHIA